jgi:hypothetical protein
MGTIAGSKPGCAILRPLIAANTETAGVIAPSPYKSEAPITTSTATQARRAGERRATTDAGPVS